MSQVGSLTSAVSDTLIRRFQGLAASSATPSLTGSSASSNSLSNGLRAGARTYGTAVQALNSVVSLVNLSQSTLEKLGDITDKAILLANTAVRPGTGVQQRLRLDREFQELGVEFEKVVANAKVGDRQYLTTEGLKELFTLTGLAPESVDSVAEVFSEFVTEDGGTALADEEIKGPKPVRIPRSAYLKKKGATPAENVYYSKVAREGENIFDGTAKLTSPPDAYRLLNDLKALKKQITDNGEVLEGSKELLQQNIQITRAAGLGLLQIRDELTTEDTAESVAEKLRTYIRQNAAAALSQANNLTSIAAAALLLSEDGSTSG